MSISTTGLSPAEIATDIVEQQSLSVGSPGDPQEIASAVESSISVFVKADLGNSGIVYVGDLGNSDLSINGIELEAGDAVSLPIDIGQQSVAVDVASGGDSVRYVVLDSDRD